MGSIWDSRSVSDFYKTIGSMYEDTTANDISPDADTEMFKILAGILQVNTLALYTFVVDYV